MQIHLTMLNTTRRFRHLLAFIILSLFSLSALALPAEIEADRLVLAAQEKIARQDFDAAKAYLEQVAPLKVEPRPVYHFLYGQVLMHQGHLKQAEDQLSQYVTKVGRNGDNYDDALRMITQIDEQLQSRNDVAALEAGKGSKTMDIQASGGSDDAYDARLLKLYMTHNLKDALVLQVNSLLNSYPYLKGRVKNLQTSDRDEYSVAVEKPSGLLVTRTRVRHAVNDGQAEITVSKLNVYGVNPYLTYICSDVADSCVIKNPANDDDWIRIADDEKGAHQLVRALTRLIKVLQS